jgi:hypothetical protein
VGELTNLCSVDANSVEAMGYVHFIWSTLVQILVCIYLIFQLLGVSALAGLLFMLLSLPVTALATSRILRYQALMMAEKDERMSIITEVLQVREAACAMSCHVMQHALGTRARPSIIYTVSCCPHSSITDEPA